MSDPRDIWPLPLAGCELVFVRHGQTTANARGIAQGRSEWPLSELGRQQAEATARHLAALGGIRALYTSPLGRAMETARAIGRAVALTPVAHEDLVETDVGVLAGRTWDDFAAEYPAIAAAVRREQQERDHARVDEQIPGWEKALEVLTRSWRATAMLAAAHPGERVVIVAHGGVLNGLLTHLLGEDAREAAWRHHLRNCAYTHLRLTAGGPVVLARQHQDHLAELKSPPMGLRTLH